MVNKLDDMLRFQQTALNARAYRQQVIASNIANADTPNFKARDLDFQAALKQALQGKSDGLQLNTTSARHLASSAGSPMANNLKFRQEEQGAVDGNTVNMDVERSAFAENAIHYQASVTFINGLISGMQRAMQSQ
ncbi:flagellar basal body rod protein FlgB [Zoogloea sp.]|uniref:flagellar basal body rod protein FlgB n=1 Tax=Zoogloea sp. TaxID=49181 RepID=UPI00261BCAC1|nr:flagellar basal body rod protein FlgB [Zoogloea sp.]MDD3352778.1 flagellar basal body rod protein FlgB [Zoogloea sp.]